MEGFQVWACVPGTRRCHHNEQCDQAQGCKGACLLLSFFSLHRWHQESPKRNYLLNKTKENNWATEFHQTKFYLIFAAITEGANHEKGQEMSSVCTCACMCPSLSVNRTLIALALQLGDFHSKENFGINKDGIFKVLQCVIICEFQLKNVY